jgi:hypothetical protein
LGSVILEVADQQPLEGTQAQEESAVQLSQLEYTEQGLQ